MFTYLGVINSMVVLSSILQVKYGYSEIDAGFYFTMPYMIAAIWTPFLGMYIEKYRNYQSVTYCGSFLMLIAHLLT